MKNLFTTIHIVQFQSGNVPEEPFITFNEQYAANKYEELLLSQGFRCRKLEETIGQYKRAYWDALECWEQKGVLPKDSPDLNAEGTVRWWGMNLSVGCMLQNLTELGYFAQHLWNHSDLQRVAEKKFKQKLSPIECRKIFEEIASTHSKGKGMNLESIGLAVDSFLQLRKDQYVIKDRDRRLKVREIDEFTYEYIREGSQPKIIDVRDYSDEVKLKAIEQYGYESMDELVRVNLPANLIITGCIYDMEK